MNIYGFTVPQSAAANNQRTLTRTGNFAAQLTNARMAPAPTTQDTISLSTRSYEARLDELRKIHENTDYSGMSDKDIALLINTRFREAFPDFGAMMGGFYLPASPGSIYDEISEESNRQFVEANNGEELKREPGEGRNIARYIHGFGGMTDEEIMEEVKRRYPTDSLADRCGAAWELGSVGVIDTKAMDNILMQIQTEMVHATEGQYGYLHRDNPIRVNAMLSYGKNSGISWTQLVRNLMAERSTWTYDTDHDRQRVLRALDHCLNDFLEKMGLPRINFL